MNCQFSFQLKELITKGVFKFNCAVVVLDFLIRHGYVTPDNGTIYDVLQIVLHVNGIDFLWIMSSSPFTE